MNRLLALLFFLTPSFSYSERIAVPTVVIDQQSSDAESPIDEYSIFKVEKVAKEKLRDSSRQNLNDVVSDQVGVDSQSYCANCGAKRLTINGLKGEHTSILIDGLPLHSAVSSFYGVDNIPTNGLSEVQVMRGAGASLTNPEAIGGTLNLITVNPLDFTNTYSTSISVDDKLSGKSQNHSLLYGLKSKNKKFGILMGGQFTRTESWDVDNNNVLEFPERENYSIMSKARFSLGKKNDFTLRVGKSYLEILGGSVDSKRPTKVTPLRAKDSDFVDGNVEKDFIGDPHRITDWIEIDRTEGAATGTHYLSNRLTYDWKFGYARQAQQAIYQHGFDYGNVDNLFVGDTSLEMFSGTNSIYTLGAFFKNQRLRSASQALFVNNPRDIKKDNFNFSSYALYAQYSHFVSEVIEVDFALRTDHIDINWLELENEIEKPIIAPRFQILHYLTHDLKQRFSYGLGYRAPLTFFESQHGNSESGYEVDIKKLEKSHSLVYSLSLNKPNYYITASAHYTHLENMAYGFETFNQPILYRNSDEAYDIWVADLLVGFKPKPWWLIEVSSEFFEYEEGYKRKLPTAAIEQRYQVKSTINNKGRWSHAFLLNIIGGRDISKYGTYNNHYVDRDQATETGVLTPNPRLELKGQKAPTFFTIDTSLSYQFSKKLSLNLGVNNLLDYTQTGEGDNPSTWHWHFNHGEFDGLHTWGPNTGRQYYLSLSGEI